MKFCESRSSVVAGIFVAAMCLPACSRRPAPPVPNRATSDASSATPSEPGPEHLASFRPLPPVEALDEAKVRLGRRLFHDPILSRDRTISCASCHSLDLGGADGHAVSTGIGGAQGNINSPTVLNARFNFVQFWNGRARDLAEQAAGPVANPAEMGHTWDAVVTTLRADATYTALFAGSYPTGVTAENVRDAIATYEMTLVTPSRFDRFLRGERGALNADERRGLVEFVTTGCTACHRDVNLGGTMYQRMGLVRDYFAERGHVTDADLGRFTVTHQESDRHMFKVPTLRNIALTGPFFHDATAATLEQAVRVMGRYQLGRELNDGQTLRIVTFLRTLTGEIPAAARLPPGEIAAPSGATQPPSAH